MQGYFLASYLYMTIVFVLPLAAGCFALALDLPVSVDEAFEGLVLPASAYVIMGKSGVWDACSSALAHCLHACNRHASSSKYSRADCTLPACRRGAGHHHLLHGRDLQWRQ